MKLFQTCVILLDFGECLDLTPFLWLVLLLNRTLFCLGFQVEHYHQTGHDIFKTYKKLDQTIPVLVISS